MGLDTDQLLPRSSRKGIAMQPWNALGSLNDPISLDDDESEIGNGTKVSQPKPVKRKALERKSSEMLEDKKRRVRSKPKPRESNKRKLLDLANKSEDESYSKSVKGPGGTAKPAKKLKSDVGVAGAYEKRLRRYRAHPPQSFNEIKERALTQRLCVLDRQRTGTPEDPSERLEIAGSTGNVYTVTIEEVPKCNCPHAKKGNQCKHIVYVMMRTLKAPTELSYQLALTSPELRQLFAGAPPLPTEVAASGEGFTDGNRKSLDDDCPICYDSFNDVDKTVWCKDGCGNNVHAECFQKWASQSRTTGGRATCPFCRTVWKDGDAKVDKGAGTINAEGYRNVASELGMSGRRDYSSYHPFWVHRQRRAGLIEDDGDYDEF